ncbi:MAG: AraC family transcriptional regulator [Dermatophilaceae bacterium]
MLPSFEYIVPTFPLTWKIHRVDVPQFESVWHFHREFELTFIQHGHGHRLVGDSVGAYFPGDLVLIGPDVPHTYISTPGEGRHVAVVMQFRRDFLGEHFFDGAVFEGIARLLDAACRGLSFRQEPAPIARVTSLPAAEQTVALLGLLVELSRRGGTPLTSQPVLSALDRAGARHIEAMVGMMHDRFASPLTLADIASAAHLAPSSASRLFRRSTGSTISSYLNVVRVNAACRLLRERDRDRTIADIAVACGYSSVSNFNRRFKEIKGVTPREYRPFDLLPSP